MFGKAAKFHHIGMLVKSIANVQPNLEIHQDSLQKVRVAFLSLNGVLFELIEPSGIGSTVENSLRRGVKLAHVCYEVPGLQEAIDQSRPHGFVCIAQPVLAAAFKTRISWLYSRNFGLFELLETAASPSP